MLKYIFLALIYLVSVLSPSVANGVGMDVQQLYRIPVVGLRWMDLAIFVVIAGYINNLCKKGMVVFKANLVPALCLLYILFESFQLMRTWNVVDSSTQVSHFICTCSLFIISDLLTFSIDTDRIIRFINRFSLAGSIVLTLSNAYLLYSFIKGTALVEDLDIRITIDVMGAKESVYTFVLTPLVYLYSLFTLQKKRPFWEKAICVAALISICLSLVYLFHRGTLLMIIILTLYYLLASGKGKQVVSKVAAIALILSLLYVAFGNLLTQKGYNPIDMVSRTVQYAFDVDDPSWDKGRIVSQQISLKAWQRNIWTGVGYDELSNNYGLPENYATAHNGIITSLFHRGIIGTSILMLIFVLLFRNAIALWFALSKSDPEKKELLRFFIVATLMWIIIFMTQEALWEKYSLSVQYLYLGLISNIYLKSAV